jgi:hypothetical protein
VCVLVSFGFVEVAFFKDLQFRRHFLWKFLWFSLLFFVSLQFFFFFFCFSVRVNWQHIISYQYNPDHQSGSDSCVTQINITVFFFF